MADPLSGNDGSRLAGAVEYGRQAQTLGQDPRHMFPREYLELTSYPLFGYRMMDGMKGQSQARREWYIKKLGKFHNQLVESATANRLPPRLLATVILNELADIDPRDQLQQQLITHLSSGSLGIAQIEVSTVLKHNLLKGFLVVPNANTAAMLLAVPQYSIEACARELRHLLDAMEADPGATWPALFKFAPPAASDRDPARYYRKGVITVEGKDSAEDREAVFARMVTAAYNGGDKFLGATNPQKTNPNSWVHGANGETIARDLFKFDLFGE